MLSQFGVLPQLIADHRIQQVETLSNCNQMLAVCVMNNVDLGASPNTANNDTRLFDKGMLKLSSKNSCARSIPPVIIE